MNLLQALLLGIIQGLCEFFPISSSAHLKFARYLLGLPGGEEWVAFDLACHLGTWIALVYFLRSEVWRVLCSWKKMALFAVALAPLIPAYFFLKPWRLTFLDPHWTGYFLLVTSALLFLGCKCKKVPSTQVQKWPSVLWIGMSQALALIPGLSRSGLTMVAARSCGWSWMESAHFSFLLAVPTILGGEVLEGLKTTTIPWVYCVTGLIASCAAGLGTIKIAFWMYKKEWVTPFAWYCLGMGLLMIAMLK